MMYHKTFPEEPEKEQTGVHFAGPSCKFTEGVRCPLTGRHCERCGHNPEVAEKRLRAFCREQGIALPGLHKQE